MSVRRFLWAAAKNALHPFRGLIGWYLRRRHTRFDRRNGVCTTGKVSLQELGLTGERSVRYEATPIRFFHSVIARLNIDYQSTVFIDFGSGKGRMLLLASHYPFRAIIGVEISRALCQIAIANSERYRAQHSGSPPISVICGGIEEFDYDCCGAADDLLI